MSDPFYAYFEGGPLAGLTREIRNPNDCINALDSEPSLLEFDPYAEPDPNARVHIHTYTRHERTGRFSWVFRCSCESCAEERWRSQSARNAEAAESPCYPASE